LITEYKSQKASENISQMQIGTKIQEKESSVFYEKQNRLNLNFGDVLSE